MVTENVALAFGVIGPRPFAKTRVLSAFSPFLFVNSKGRNRQVSIVY